MKKPMTEYNLRHIQQHFSKSAHRYDEAAVLQKLTAEQLDERLGLVKLDVQSVADIGAGTGFLTEKLQQRYPQAEVFAVDLAEPMLRRAQKRMDSNKALNTPSWLTPIRKLWDTQPLPKVHYIQADAYRLPLATGSLDLIVTNFMLQWCDRLDEVLMEFRRVIKPNGLLMLTSLGPDTLKELRQAWYTVEGEAAHQRMNHFIDMHDVGDALIRAGFGQPVMDVEHYTMTYSQPIDVIKDLKALGATNAAQDRTRVLTGKNKFKKMLEAYESQRQNDKVCATYEVIHGHAWAAPEVFKGPNRSKSGVYEITLDQFQKNLKLIKT
jgi:malonyl-CoA O-methyltransferase